MNLYKPILWLSLVGVFLLSPFKERRNTIFIEHIGNGTDTMPNICSVLPASEIDGMHIFNNPLTKSYTEPDPVENFQGCHYEFYKPNDYPSLSIELQKWSTKDEAGNVFHQWQLDHHDIWGIDPERILHVADSASFDWNTNDLNHCDLCSFVASQGIYMIYINFKGQMDEVPRDRKKAMAINIVHVMFERIPELAPQFIRNKGN